jgi:hypothetical protein
MVSLEGWMAQQDCQSNNFDQAALPWDSRARQIRLGTSRAPSRSSDSKDDLGESMIV